MQPIEDGHDVEIERRPPILRAYLHSRLSGLRAGSDAWFAIDIAQAVGASARSAKQATGAMVLEASRKDMLTGIVQRAGDGLSPLCFDGFSVESELKLFV